MWNRKVLKAKAKAAFKRNYWNCVLVAFVVGLVMMVSVGGGEAETEGAKIAVNLSAGATAFAILIRAFAVNPFDVGGKKFFADNSEANAPLNDLVAGFTGNYIRNVLGMILRDIFIALWSMLFIIPGIIKSYSYMMVPYILADDPQIGAKEAIDLSRKMMHGNKWSAFVLDLSFIGWHLLNILTFGLLGLFYINPYVDSAHAELYLALRETK